MKQTKVNSSSVSQNVIWKLGERMIAQLVAFVVSLILARLLSPDEYGLVAMATVFITFCNTFVDGSFSSALVQKADADDIDFSSVFFFNIVFSMILYTILFFTAPIIASFYANEKIKDILRVLGLSILVMSVKSVQHAYVSKKMLFRKFFWSTLLGTLLSCAVGITMAYLGFGVWALVAQSMVNTTMDTLVLWITVKWRPKLMFSFIRLKKLISYSWKILFESMANTIVTEVRSLIIGKVYTPSALSYYTKAQTLPRLLVQDISSSLNAVLFPAMSFKQDKPQQIILLLRKTVCLSSYVLFPMLTGLAVAAKPIISVLLSDKWLECVPFMQVFCFTQAMAIGLIPRHQALKATGRSDIFMYEHILSRTVGVILLICVFRINVMAIAITGIVSSAILTCVVMFTSKKYNGYQYQDQIADVLPTLCGCAFMGIPVYFIQFLNISNLAILTIQILCGIILYIVFSAVFKLIGYKITLGYVKQVFRKVLKRNEK